MNAMNEGSGSSNGPTRRQVLAGTAAMLAGVSEPGSVNGTGIKSGFIDAHSHIWTRDVARFPLANGNTVDDLKPPSFTAEELMKVCHPHGVDRVVLIQHHIYHGWDNSYLIDAAKRYPDTFRVVGMVDDLSDKPDQQMRALLNQRVTAFRITSLIRGKGKWLTGPGMTAMWKCAAQTRQAMCCLINPEDLTAVDTMCSRFPDTPVVIDHFARIGVDGQMRAADIDRLCRLARYPHVSLKLSAYYALGARKPPYLDLIPMIKRVFDAFGPDRLMWASDSPYQMDEANTYEASIALVRDGLNFLTLDDRNALLRRTAERVYFW